MKTMKNIEHKTVKSWNKSPTIRKLRRDVDKLPLWKRLLRIRQRPAYEIVDYPGYEYACWVDGQPITLFAPWGTRTDFASSPGFSWAFGFLPDGDLGIGAIWHDLYYRNGFLLDHNGQRIFAGRGKGFADALLREITIRESGLRFLGFIAEAVLAAAGWPAWWSSNKCRARVAADPDEDAFSLHGEYGD